MFDKDRGKTFENASNLDIMTETELDTMSRVLTREAPGYQYGLDEHGGYAGRIAPLKPATGHSNITRMTRKTNQTAITRFNRGGLQPFINKVGLKGQFDAASKIDGVSTKTRKFHSNVRGANITHQRRDSASIEEQMEAPKPGGGKFVTIQNNTSSMITPSVKYEHGDPSGPGGTRERPAGTNLPEINNSPFKNLAGNGITYEPSFNPNMNRKYSLLSRNSRGSI